MDLIIHPFSEQTLGNYLKELLHNQNGIYHSFQAAVAFAKISGVQHIQEELRQFRENGGFVRMVIGIDQYGTSQEALFTLLEAVQDRGEIWINHDEAQYVSFHPKIYFFEGIQEGLLIVGSGNLTQGGLFTNDEASSAYLLDYSNGADLETASQVKTALDGWCNLESGTANQLSFEFLEELVLGEYIKHEAELKLEITVEATLEDYSDEERKSKEKKERIRLFGRRTGRKRPPKRTIRRPTKITVQPFEEENIVSADGFVMTLMKTDVGVGQLTPGTSRRSPEIFIPLVARNAFPEFWKWPDAFTEDAGRTGKFDRFGVQMRLGGEIISVNMMTWPVKSDFRLRSEALRSAGQIGDILRIERVEASAGYEYYVEIVPQGTSDYEYYLSFCVNRTRANSSRVWGYYRISEAED